MGILYCNSSLGLLFLGVEISNTDLPLTVLGSGISHSFIFRSATKLLCNMARSFPSSTGRIHLPANRLHPALLPALHCPCSKYHPAPAHSQVTLTAALLRQLFKFGKKRGFVQKKSGAFGGDLGPFLLLTQRSVTE